MSTQTLPVPDLVESLDFEPTCEAASGCDRAAQWFGELPCKCAAHLGCDPHYRQTRSAMHGLQWICRRCGAYFAGDDIIWRPL